MPLSQNYGGAEPHPSVPAPHIAPALSPLRGHSGAHQPPAARSSKMKLTGHSLAAFPPGRPGRLKESPDEFQRYNCSCRPVAPLRLASPTRETEDFTNTWVPPHSNETPPTLSLPPSTRVATCQHGYSNWSPVHVGRGQGHREKGGRYIILDINVLNL